MLLISRAWFGLRIGWVVLYCGFFPSFLVKGLRKHGIDLSTEWLFIIIPISDQSFRKSVGLSVGRSLSCLDLQQVWACCSNVNASLKDFLWLVLSFGSGTLNRVDGNILQIFAFPVDRQTFCLLGEFSVWFYWGAKWKDRFFCEGCLHCLFLVSPL